MNTKTASKHAQPETANTDASPEAMPVTAQPVTASTHAQPATDVTIVVPYYNESQTIQYTLEQIARQVLPAKTVLLINSSSTDDSFQKIQKWIHDNQPLYPSQFKNIDAKTLNPSSSKNAGIQLAETQWIAFMDCGQQFDVDWLFLQSQFIKQHQVDVVSGGVILEGAHCVDRAAVAQTFGYKRFRPCVPTTLMKKNIFNRTGLFLADRRSGYDIVWPKKLEELAIPRGINPKVIIRYIGSNFAHSLKHLIQKTIFYAKPTAGLPGYSVPYFYVCAFILALLLLFMNIRILICLMGLHLLSRATWIPFLKARSTLFWKEHFFEAVIVLGPIGVLMDLCRTFGILQGFYGMFLKRFKGVLFQIRDE